MTDVPLDHLRKLEPREAWSNEAVDFTPWLAREENFQVLADTLHLVDAEVEATEHTIGSFSADIVARDRDGTILIENQLEQTDHTHLGQILTYLAGLKGALKVVWIATKVREEHRAAIDWLNAHTPEGFSFFAVELELYRIGDSPAAPYFHVAARPNEWSRHVSARARQISETALTEREQRYVEYWTAVGRFLNEHDPDFSNPSPPKGHWWSLGIGKSFFALTLLSVMRDHWIGVELYCSNDEDKFIFDHFHEMKEEIESEFGEPLEWERLDGRKGSRIAIRLRNADPGDNNRWPDYFAWYRDKMQRFRRCFAGKLKDLDVDALAGSASQTANEQPSQ